MFGKVRVMITTGRPVTGWYGTARHGVVRFTWYPVVIGR